MTRAVDPGADATRERTDLDDALARWDPATGIAPAVARAQTRRAATLLAATSERLGRDDLTDRLADGTTLDTAIWWGRAVDPGLRRLADADLVEYHAVADTYRWVGEGGNMTRDDARKYDRWKCTECGRFPPSFEPTFAADPERWVCRRCRDE